MRNRTSLLAALVGVCACASASEAAADTSAIRGTWRMVLDPSWMPVACGDATFTIDAETITSRSGSLVITAKYDVEVTDTGFILRYRDIRATGQANCQGVSKQDVMENLIKDLPVAVVDGRLRIYFPRGRHADFERVVSSTRARGVSVRQPCVA